MANGANYKTRNI